MVAAKSLKSFDLSHEKFQGRFIAMYDVFSLPNFKFPRGFLWGSASAGHQVEGDNINSDAWHREQMNKEGEFSGKACDNWRLFREDVQLINSLGHQAYRYSIEWSRIEPDEGCFNQLALDHYKEMSELFKQLHIKTFVTLNHFTVPQWFAEKGGFHKRENISYFLRYVEKVVKALMGLADFYLIINESTHTKIDTRLGFNYLIAHARAYRLIKSICDVPVSSAHMAIQTFPYRYYDELDRIMAAYRDFQYNGCFLHAIATGELISPFGDAEECPELKGAVDYWAINLYTRELIDSRRKNLSAPRLPHKKLRMIDQDFYMEEMYPECMTFMLERFRDKPIYITENGCCCNDDRFRIVYLVLYLSAMHDALKQGMDIRGYLYWSLMDNYEWNSFLPRFGLVNVDFKTFARTPKPSAIFYREIIKHNGFSQEILRKYLHELPILETIRK